MSNDWFATWFDSPYYHKLYANRDFSEAEHFLNKLVSELKILENAHILDLACGRGRHSLFLNKKGFRVTGLDLSKNSIDSLQEYNSDTLKFDVWDMREVYMSDTFDYVFNLFTSFGYFDDENDNLKVLKAIHTNLKDNGVLVLDYLNAKRLRGIKHEDQVVERKGEKFFISKDIEKDHIVKSIKFSNDGRTYHYEEKVQLIDLDLFKNLLTKAGFKIEKTLGSYDLGEYEPNESERLILIAKKI